MLQVPQRTVVRGPAFIRLLAGLIRADVPPPDPSLSDRLSQWLDWKHALALSTALDGGSSPASADGLTVEPVAQQECARARAIQVEALAAAMAGSDVAERHGRKLVAKGDAWTNEVDYALFRQRYLARQRAMQSVTGELRDRLRNSLAAQSAQMVRLAEVDAAMELALSPREQSLLAKMPALLEVHFDNLRQAALAEGSTSRGSWLERFRNDMHSVLLAELDVRFQPVDALLAALRTC